MKIKQIRLRLTSNMCDNVSYITITDGVVQHFSASEIPLSLSNITEDAAELRFALTDATSAASAYLSIKKFCKLKNVEII